MTTPAFTIEEEIVLHVLSRAWEPKTARWVSNGCTIDHEEAHQILVRLSSRGAVARLEQEGIDEHGFDYTYDAFIFPDRVTPWMLSD